MSSFHLIRLFNFMNNPVFCIIIIHLNPVKFHLFVSLGTLRIAFFMDQFAFKNKVGGVLHGNTIGE